MLLPGALRYGGVLGMAAIADGGVPRGGPTRLAGIAARPVAPWAPRPSTVTIESSSASAEDLADWVLRR
jgi:hypothetical protein